MNEKFRQAVPLIEKIENAGFQAYFVGGSVRDYLLGKPIEDVDIATSAYPEEIKQLFPKTIDVGIQHGTVGVLYEGVLYEITTFRSESEYTNYRRPKEVKFIRSLTEDLKRRDFTMNAVAMTKDGKLIDPFHGQEDIQRKLIRTVGKPAERFKEDALRIMRAIRFVSQLSFRVEGATYMALKKYGHLLKHIYVARIYAEFSKILAGETRKQAFLMIVDRNLYPYLPGLDGYGREIGQAGRLLHARDWTEEEMWALLLILIKKESPEPFLRKWKMPVKMIRTVRQIYEAFQYRKENGWTKYAVYQFGIETSYSTEKIYCAIKQTDEKLSLAKLKRIARDLPITNRKELKVTGNDLMEWYQKKGGPWVKDVFEKIEKAVINREVENDRERIKEWLDP